MSKPLIIQVPGHLNTTDFERLIYTIYGVRLLDPKLNKVVFHFPSECFVIVDGALKLLTLVNYLAHEGKAVELQFESELTYLSRICFFQRLHPEIVCDPVRDKDSDARMGLGVSSNLVEIQSVGLTKADGPQRRLIPVMIAERMEAAYAAHPEKEMIADTCATLMSELTENIVLHSKSVFEGFAALQTFKENGTIILAVSDAGLGILETVKSHLKPKYASMADSALLVEMFNNGKISRSPSGGAGLFACAKNSLKFKAELWLRLPTCRVLLKPAKVPGQYNMANCWDNLPFFPGTHISFQYHLAY